jgi:putative hydrolase of the HAD superfamily
MSDPVEAVLLDVDGTICEYRRSAERLLELAFEDVGVDPFFGEREYLGRYAEFADDGEDVREVREVCFAALAEAEGYGRETGHALAEAFAAERDHSAVDFLPGAKDAIDALAEQYPLGVVTNGDPWMQSQKLEGLGIADDFETIVHAGYDAPAKPDPGPFHHALDEMGLEGRSAVHVGNSLVSDVPGAKAAGLDAVWLDDGSDHRGEPDYVLDSMHDLREPPW